MVLDAKVKLFMSLGDFLAACGAQSVITRLRRLGERGVEGVVKTQVNVVNGLAGLRLQGRWAFN